MTIWNSTENPDSSMGDANEGIGLQGIRERLADLGGEMRKGVAVDGYSLRITIPKKEFTYGAYARNNR